MLALAACTNTVDDASGDEASAMIGGQENATTAPAVGALVHYFNGADGPLYDNFCTATLIAPKRVLTAKHCTMATRGKFGFALGPIARSDVLQRTGPTRVIEADSFVEVTAVGEGGALGIGSDVAVVRLKQAIMDIAPLPVADVRPTDLGETMTVVGYGMREDGTRGARRAGKVTIKALRGNALASLVPFEAYQQAFGGDVAESRSAYDATTLLEGYELAVARAPGANGAQPCEGDSGGPLLRKKGRSFEVLGVASLVFQKPGEECTYGTVYATLGPKARTLVEAERGAR
ncbi:MAG: trypsin-like serine protease [Myxococcales bacterium]|nr:trypsin-like serine protease [Myxococcales bacterium]